MKKVGLVCCSDGLAAEKKEEIACLKKVLKEMGIVSVECSCMYRGQESISAGPPAERAEALMKMYRNTEIDAIFDLSGGNLANQILPWLNYEIIKNSGKEFWGYSDLTVLLNAIYTKTGNTGWLYQPRMLVGRNGDIQQECFTKMVKGQDDSAFFPDDWRFLQGNHIEGVLVGGNIRCFLKLAGTEYFPDLQDKVLILESLGGGEGVITSLLTQLQQIGAFRKISGLLLGTFTELDGQEGYDAVERFVMETIDNKTLPVARTMQIGHGSSSRGIRIGESIKITKSDIDR